MGYAKSEASNFAIGGVGGDVRAQDGKVRFVYASLLTRKEQCAILESK